MTFLSVISSIQPSSLVIGVLLALIQITTIADKITTTETGRAMYIIVQKFEDIMEEVDVEFFKFKLIFQSKTTLGGITGAIA